eukprot:4074281-Karenia_brevis.AAC.1
MPAKQAFSEEWPTCLKYCAIMPEELPGVEDSLAFAAADDEGDCEDDYEELFSDSPMQWQGSAP